jgi:hypothetical protein
MLLRDICYIEFAANRPTETEHFEGAKVDGLDHSRTGTLSQ